MIEVVYVMAFLTTLAGVSFMATFLCGIHVVRTAKTEADKSPGFLCLLIAALLFGIAFGLGCETVSCARLLYPVEARFR